MPKLLILLLCALTFSQKAFSQSPLSKQWDYRFGGTSGDLLFSTHSTFDGGFILCGFSYSGIGGDKTQPSWGSSDYWIVKIDSIGLLQWNKRFGGTNEDELYSAQQTTDGGFILGGFSRSDANGDKSQPNWDTTFYSSPDFWILKLDSVGNKQWDKRFGGTNIDKLSVVQQTVDNGFMLGGSSYSGISGDRTQSNWGAVGFTADYWIVKTDLMGNKQWDKRFGGDENDFLTCMRQTSDHGYILGGDSYSDTSGDKSQPNWFDPGNRADYWIVKTDSIGNKQWDKRFGGYSYENLKSIDQTNDGGYILGGFSLSGISGDKTQPSWGALDIWVVKIDSVGNIEWERRYGGTDAEELFNILITKDNGFLFSGESYSNISGDKSENNLGIEQSWLIKTDSLGSIEWDKTIFTNGHDEQTLISKTHEECYVVANRTNAGIGGYKTQPSWGNNDYWIIKFCDSTFTSSLNLHEFDNCNFKLYPSPAKETLYMNFSCYLKPTSKVQVFDMLGREVKNFKIEQEKTKYIIDISLLSSGVFIVKYGTKVNKFVKD